MRPDNYWKEKSISSTEVLAGIAITAFLFASLILVSL